MRKRFEQQLHVNQLPISETAINPKAKNSLNSLMAALLSIFLDETYNEQLFLIIESHLTEQLKQTGRNGMDLWVFFVLAQVRLCQDISYADLHDLANNHHTLRTLLGVETNGFDRKQFEYQNIYDNVSLFTDDMVRELNELILDFGHNQVFKKKSETALALKSDSYVVESNVHFPTDYNLLWDSLRKIIDAVSKLLKKYDSIG